MFCKNCGSEIKEGAKFCPKCGESVKREGGNDSTPVSAPEVKVTPSAEAIPSIASMTAPESGKKTQNNPGKAAGEKGREFVRNILQSISGSGDRAAADGGEKAWKKRIPVIVGLAVVIAVVLGIMNGARLNNLWHRTFSSPEKYYQFVEKKTVKEAAENAGEIYDSCLLSALNFYDKSRSGEFTVELEEDGQEFLGLLGLTGVDLSWLKSVSLGVDTSIKDNVVSTGVSVSVNKNKLLSGNVVAETDKEKYFVQIPELNKAYLEIDASEKASDDYGNYAAGGILNAFSVEETREANKKLLDACPDKVKTQRLMARYMNLLVECIDDVTKSKDTLSVEGISKKYTVLNVKIDSGAMQEMAETLLTEMQSDEEIKTIITDILYASEDIVGDEMDVDEIYESFQESLENLTDSLRGISYGDEKITMKVYVDGKGNIVGRKIKYGDVAVNVLMPEKGKKFGYELSGEMYGVSVKLTGSGKRSGDCIDGDFQIKYNGASLVDITADKFNTEEFKKGQINGKITVKPASKLGSLAGNIPGFSIIEDMELALDFDSAKEAHACKLTVIYDGQNIGSVFASVKTGKGTKKQISNKETIIVIEDEDDISEWIEGIDLTELIESARKAGFPDDFTDALEEADDMLEDADMDALLYYLY